MSYHAVFLDEWICIRANRRLCGGRACSICGEVRKRAHVWCNFKTREVRCRKCFNAEAAHWARDDELMAERRRWRRAPQGTAP
jgi:hypothetical protein